MSTATPDEPGTTDEPRRTIATSSLRALRAARGDASPAAAPPATAGEADTAPDDDDAGETEPAAAVDTDTAVDDTDTAAGDTADDTTDNADTPDDDTTAIADAPDADTTDNADAPDDDDTTDNADAAVDDTDIADAPDDDTTAIADAPDDDDDTTAIAETDTDTDDAPPVLASGRPRRPKRTPAATTTDVPARARRRPSRLTAISAVVAAAALVFGVVSGVVWWRADHDSERAVAVARDDVVVDARLAVATVNTSDYRKPDAALRNWLAVSTGTLKSQFTDQRKPAITLLGQSKIITSATVLDAAVTKLDTAKGSATVIVSVNLKRKPATGAATTARNRFRATLSRQGDDWKLADLVLVGFQVQ